MKTILLLWLATAPAPADSVFVCTGPRAYTFHARPTCSGVQQCYYDVVKRARRAAEGQGRRPCWLCYSRQSR